MASRERIKDLIGYVVDHRFFEALKEFYHEDAAVRENNEEPRIGMEENLQHEEMFLNRVSEFHEIKARSYIVDGDLAAIRWIIDATLKSGERMKREEIAYQRWSGDKIICEQFFYDPGPG